jgi:hypothetical protein
MLRDACNDSNSSSSNSNSGPGSSVGIATELRVGRSGDRIPVEARFSAPVQTGPGVHPASCTMGTGSFPGVKYGRGVLLTTHPLLVPRSWKSRAIPLPTLWGPHWACNRVTLAFSNSNNIHPPSTQSAAVFETCHTTGKVLTLQE